MGPACCWSLTTFSSQATSLFQATAVWFGIEDEFDVASVDRIGLKQVKVIIEVQSREGPCRTCGVFSALVKDGQSGG